MNEKELYESIVKNRILDDDTIKRAARTAIPKKRGVFDRILKPVIAIPVAAALLLSIALMIPSARAEVFSWFSPASAQDYLSADPGERTPDPELDARDRQKLLRNARRDGLRRAVDLYLRQFRRIVRVCHV